jgi:hypothetical protein
MKQQSSLKYILKLNSSRLRKAKWSLNITINEAIEYEEMISLSDSATLRFIRDINNRNLKSPMDVEGKAREIKTHIKSIKLQPTNAENRRKIKALYQELYDLLFVKDYVHIVIDKPSDFDRMNSPKGFYINGVKFKRLLATSGGAKKSTVVYVSEKVYDELVERIENGRNKEKPFVPAKLEAYKSLACSSSTPVSMPKGVLVVKDCETTFKANVIEIDDTKTDYPQVKPVKDYEITLNDSDGYGLISPELSEQWAKELNEYYIPSGFCIRNSFTKGMLFTFDFHAFSREVAKNNIVIDAWGHERDMRTVQIVLTTSMLKLWDSYNSIEHYLECCEKNGYSFSVTKMTPEVLENERNLNYQFIQSLFLSDQDIDELIEPTVNEIKDVLGGDWRKSILFLKGVHLHENSFDDEIYDFTKALMINPKMINDPFVKTKIHNMIKKRINQAKVGVLKVQANFSTVSGDPYSLCQSMFGMEVTGLLKAGEFYSKYWNDRNVDKVACFRAPMTCHNNIRILRLKNTKEMQKWYKYMDTITVFNSWDTTTHALNGADKDGDTVFTTNNPVILRGIKELDSIVCIQKTTSKKLVDETDLILANKNSFGDEIGSTTNRITAKFDVLANFKEGSPEYKELQYRIQCGQNYQQNAIDKTKGIECKSMPKEWFDYHANKNLPDDKKAFNLSILADKKPYFFIYIYPHLMKAYKDHIKSYEDNCWENFRMSVKDLLSKANKTEQEEWFAKDYYKRMPVFTNPSIMNKICWKIESTFDGVRLQFKNEDYDCGMLKSDKVYSKARFQKVKVLYESYKREVQSFAQRTKKERIAEEEQQTTRAIFKSNFKRQAEEICNDAEELCNIVIDLCYSNNSSKQFVWDLCGEQIIKNLLEKSNYRISYPIIDDNGDIEFGGSRFSMHEEVLDQEEINEVSFE